MGMMTWSMMNLQDSNCYILTMMGYFHDFMMMILLFILLFILYIMMWFLLNKFINLNILHNHLIEFIWTLIPMVILMFLAIPSLKILYSLEEYFNPLITIKILGHQWYWNYEYSDLKNVEFDSFMIDLINKNSFRLLDVDNRLILPMKIKIRGLVSSIDVIHSWSMPSLGLKIDATPGRLNQFMMFINRPGLFYGQCSEICGLNHSFMPIVMEVINLKNFFLWLNKI